MRSKRRTLLFGVLLVMGLGAACKPQVSLQTSRERVRQGEEVTLTWTSKNAKTVTINGEPVAKAGSKSVKPQQTTSYEALAKRGDREARAFARVEVEIPTPAPTLTFSADRDVIERSQSTTLRWTTTNAESVEIAGIGRQAASGSARVSPEDSTTYTATATGPGGTDTKSVRVTVNIPPPPPPPPPPKPTTRTRRVDEEFIQAVKVIYFAFDSSELDDESQARLGAAASWLNRSENRSIRFRIEGNCDERGTEEYNIGLGDRRANAARDFLIGLGVAAERIETVSYGESRPAVNEHNEEAWAKNRRDEFVYLEGGETVVPLVGGS
jgi:peptidoglycan-associated lipoprotein